MNTNEIIKLKVKMSNTIRRPVMRTTIDAEHRDAAELKARDIFFRKNYKLTGDSFRIECYRVNDSWLCIFIDYYFVKQLSFSQYVRHIYRELLAAVLFHKGPCANIVEIEDN